MNDLRDSSIDKAYREASIEQPGAAADAAILALAREAAAQAGLAGGVARRAAGGSARSSASAGMRRWRAPLALAASVVLTIGIVTRIGLEPPDGAMSNPERVGEAAPAGRSEPAVVAAERKQPAQSAAAPESPALAKAEVAAPASAYPTPAPAPPVPFAPRPTADARPVENAGPRPSATISAMPSRAPDLTYGPAAAGGAGVATAPAAVGEMRRDAAAAPVMKSAQRVARDSAESATQDATARAASPVLSEAREAALAPDAWINYVVDLRRLGQHDAADASLKRFRARYPDFGIPAQANPPAQSPPSPSGETK